MNKIKNEKILIKIGGASLEDQNFVASMCKNIAQLRKNGNKVIVVHGGGVAINRELELRNIKWSFHEGQRVTTKEMMETIEMVLCGKNNKALVRYLNNNDVPAFGLSGVDNKTIQCKIMDEKLGEVGEIVKIDTEIFDRLSDYMVPVVAPIGLDMDSGNVLNINADWVASSIAETIKADKLIYLTDTSGILDADGKTMPVLCADDLNDLIEKNIVTGGMLAKVRSVLKSLSIGVKEIYIVNGKVKDPLLAMEGTSCKKHK